MARDLEIDDTGDLVIDETTHDLSIIEGADEIAQRIKATLDIRYGEMTNLDPDMGADYTNFLGKDFNEELAGADMEAAITANVPEVTSVDSITFTRKGRQLFVSFTAHYQDDDTDTEEEVEGDYTIES